MHFDNNLAWVGFNYEESDHYLVGEVANMKVIDRSNIGDIVRFAATGHNMIVVRCNPEEIKANWQSIDDVFNQLEIMSGGLNYIDGRIVTVCNENALIQIQIPIIKDSRYANNLYELKEYVVNVLKCTKGLVQVEIDEEGNNRYDLATLIPLHDGVPVAWIEYNTGKMVQPDSIYDASRSGLSTESILSWFNNAVANWTGEKVIPMSIIFRDVRINFNFNSGYRRYNGSLAHWKILLPVFAKFIAECIYHDYFGQVAWCNWNMWTNSDGSINTLLATPDPEGYDPDADDSTSTEVEQVHTDCSVGEWVFREQYPAGKNSRMQNVIPRADMMLQFITRVNAVENTVEDMKVLNCDNEQVSVYSFVVKEGVRVMGHVVEIRKALEERLDADGIGTCSFLK